MRRTMELRSLIVGSVISVIITTAWQNGPSFAFVGTQSPIQEVAQPTRRIDVLARRDLLRELQLADSVLEVPDNRPPPSFGPPPPEYTLAEFKTLYNDAVAEVRVTKVTARLTDDRTWIVSAVESIVLEAFKEPAPAQLSQGSKLVFMADGGELKVGHKLIRGIKSKPADSFRPGRTYLIFGTIGPNHALWVTDSDSYERVGEKLRALDHDARGDGISKSERISVLNDVRARAKQSRPNLVPGI